MKHARAIAVASLVMASLPFAARSQDAGSQQLGDWDLMENAAQKSLMAVTLFDNGLAFMVGCIDGRYEAAIIGLPPTTGRVRDLGVRFRDGRVSQQSWFVARRDVTALAPLPAPIAREMRLGGQVEIIVPRGAPDGRGNLRYRMELPSSSSAIDQTLTRCERPLTDPRDVELLDLPSAGLPVMLEWAPPPRIGESFNPVFDYGWTVISCLTRPEGRLESCEVETEQPPNSGYARAALRALERARVRDPRDPGAPLDRRLLHARFNFVMEGFEEGAEAPPPIGSRISRGRR